MRAREQGRRGLGGGRSTRGGGRRGGGRMREKKTRTRATGPHLAARDVCEVASRAAHSGGWACAVVSRVAGEAKSDREVSFFYRPRLATLLRLFSRCAPVSRLPPFGTLPTLPPHASPCSSTSISGGVGRVRPRFRGQPPRGAIAATPRPLPTLPLTPSRPPTLSLPPQVVLAHTRQRAAFPSPSSSLASPQLPCILRQCVPPR